MSASTPQEQILGIVNHWQSCCVGAAAQLELADLPMAPCTSTFLRSAQRRTGRACIGCCGLSRARGSSLKPRLEYSTTRRRANVSAATGQAQIGLGFDLRSVRALRYSRGGEG
jgi:hypothetical protein